MKLVHQAGTKMIQSDTLSRRLDHIPEEDNDNNDIILLPDTLFGHQTNIDPDVIPIQEIFIYLADTAVNVLAA